MFLLQPAAFNQVRQGSGDILAANLQMTGDKFGYVAVIAAKAVDLGVGQGQHSAFKQLDGIKRVDDVQLTAVDGHVGVILAQEE